MSPSPPPSGAAPAFLAELSGIVAPSRISTRRNELATYSRDLCPRSLIRVAAGEAPATLPEAVVWPESVDEIQAIVRLCAARGIPIVPYGAGSGVSRGIEPSSGLVLDTKRMRRVLSVDESSGAVSFQPGILGWHLEEQLNRRGLTLGHFPSSIMCSTAGGWLATRSAGQCSSKYGKIEDLVRDLDVVLGDGTLMRAASDRRDFAQLFVGSEGSLGVITRATCTARPLPAARRMRGYWFPTVEGGCRAMQRLLECGLRPAVVRLYDEIDTLLSSSGHGHKKSGPDLGGLPGLGAVLKGLGISERPDIEDLIRVVRGDAQRVRGQVERWLVRNLLGRPLAIGRLLDAALQRLGVGCMLILGFEGEPAIVAAEEQDARNQLAMLGARDLGEEPGEHWLRHRYDVSFKLSRAFAAGAYADTIEVASTWDRLLPLYNAVREALLPHALVMAHFSHAYPDGCSIYFSVLGRRRSASTLDSIERRTALAEDLDRYDALWDSALTAAVAAGGTISHHHGTGRLKRRHLPAEHGASFSILTALKAACDPQGILNPGSLLDPPKSGARAPEAPPSERSLKPPTRVGSIRDSDLVCDAPASVRLFELEAALRKSGRTLGGLPPTAYLRTLGEALAAPRALEACLDAQRFLDRRLRLFATLPSGQAVVAPPKIAPRRATGPDLGHALLGQTEAATITGATLRLLPHLPSRYSAHLYERADEAVRALYAARMLHGGVALAEIFLLSRALATALLGSTELPQFAYALVCRAACPPALVESIESLCAERLAAGRIGLLSDETARPLWEVGELSEAALAPRAQKFPTVESLYDGPSEPLARALARPALAAGRVLVGGVTLHRVALCTDEPVAELGDRTDADRGAASAEQFVGPRLIELLAQPVKGARD